MKNRPKKTCRTATIFGLAVSGVYEHGWWKVWYASWETGMIVTRYCLTFKQGLKAVIADLAWMPTE